MYLYFVLADVQCYLQLRKCK